MAGRARRSVQARREEILSTTVELLDRVGLAATRVADVASALDVSPALVFYHFGTKDDLVAEAFAHAVERDLVRMEKAAHGDADPVERLRRVLRLYGPTGRATGWRISFSIRCPTTPTPPPVMPCGRACRWSPASAPLSPGASRQACSPPPG